MLLISIITAVTEVFSAISEWLITAIQDVTVLFYAPETGLTLLGVLALMSLGISVIFLLIRVVQNFLHFRG